MNSIRLITVLLCLLSLTACDSRSKHAFLQGCQIATGQDHATCSCAYDKLKVYYPPEVIDHINEPTWQEPSDFGKATVKAIVQCRPDYQAILNQAQ